MAQKFITAGMVLGLTLTGCEEETPQCASAREALTSAVVTTLSEVVPPPTETLDAAALGDAAERIEQGKESVKTLEKIIRTKGAEGLEDVERHLTALRPLLSPEASVQIDSKWADVRTQCRIDQT